MKCDCSALFVHNPKEPKDPLKESLARMCGQIREAQTCKEAEAALGGSQPPHLVFTDAMLRDGSWREILNLAEKASQAVNVIVVSPELDQRLYLEAVQRGAYDFVAEPILPSDLDFIVRSAAGNACRRRSHAQAA